MFAVKITGVEEAAMENDEYLAVLKCVVPL